MSLRESVTQGDWVRAEAKNGSVIEGQATESISWGGDATLTIRVSGDGASPTNIHINVNFWDVQVTRQNIIGRRA